MKVKLQDCLEWMLYFCLINWILPVNNQYLDILKGDELWAFSLSICSLGQKKNLTRYFNLISASLYRTFSNFNIKNFASYIYFNICSFHLHMRMFVAVVSVYVLQMKFVKWSAHDCHNLHFYPSCTSVKIINKQVPFCS